MSDLDALAKRLNGAGLSKDWHSVHGTRFDQAQVEVEFECAADGEAASLSFAQAQRSAAPSPQ
ncbi:MAG: hypothetical protein K2X44_05475 [Magnetospirillum sp.]|nr:hypothetical protein [Magnetospirillum sp.]